MRLEDALMVIQMIIAVALVIVIVFQARGGGLGSLMGGSDAGGGVSRTRRGLEKTLYQVTIGLAFVFIANSILQLLIQ